VTRSRPPDPGLPYWRRTGFQRGHPFNDLGWPYLRSRIADVDWPDGHVYLLDIIDSVTSLGADRFLAADASMHDLIVTLKPVNDPPVDVIAVRAPNSFRKHPAGTVLIEFVSTLGKHTSSERPANEAVALFWRYVETAFGIRPSV
jgi:hypothetical protein